jgi:hypothetical protein
MKALRTAAVTLATLASAVGLAHAQFPKIDPPKWAHISESNLIPLEKIPMPDLGKLPKLDIDLPPGHKTNKWQIKHNLEAGGWWVAYGKEINYDDYADFARSVAASVAADNPAPAMAFLKVLVAESIDVLTTNAGKEFGDRLRSVAERELVKVFYEAMKNGRVQTISIKGAELQLGMATYNRSEAGIPLPNTFQPYMRMRLVLGGVGGRGNSAMPKYHWVATLYNPTDAKVNYSFNYGDEREQYTLEPHGWRWHSHDSTDPPDFKALFDTGPAGNHKEKAYHLNTHRLLLGTKQAEDKGQPYTFRYDPKRGWDLFSGRPEKK